MIVTDRKGGKHVICACGHWINRRATSCECCTGKDSKHKKTS